MALGLNTQTGGGDFLPIIKYDARAGRFFRRDRLQVDGQWTATDVDVSDGFTAAFDFDSCEVGWIKFGGGGNPDFKLAPIGQPLPPKPNDDYKQGFRLRIWGKSLGGWREFSHTAKTVLGVIDRLHDEYVKAAPLHPGQIPVLKSAGVVAIVTGNGATKSTNYQPSLSIVGWVERPPADVKSAQATQPAQRAAPQAPPTVTVIQPAPAQQQQAFNTEF